MIIDVSCPETFPIELERAILKYFSNLPQKITEKIKATHIEYDKDVRCAIEDYVGLFKADALYKELALIMEQNDLICYHATKVINKESIIEGGLKLNEWKWYSKTLIQNFQKLGAKADDIERVMELVRHEYDRKYIDRQAAICFFSDLSLISDNQSAGCEQFCESIGGEIARWTLKEKEPGLYRLLKENGESVIVKFVLPFSDIAWFQKEAVIYQFISYVAGKYFWNYKYQIQFEVMTTTCVAPNQILELLPYTKEIDY